MVEGQKMGKERRREERRPIEMQIDCEVDGSYLLVDVRDISSLGMFIKTRHPLATGSELTASFAAPRLPGRPPPEIPQEPLRLRGRVVWSTGARGDATDAGMGVEFIEPSAEERKSLLAMVEAVAYYGLSTTTG